MDDFDSTRLYPSAYFYRGRGHRPEPPSPMKIAAERREILAADLGYFAMAIQHTTDPTYRAWMEKGLEEKVYQTWSLYGDSYGLAEGFLPYITMDPQYDRYLTMEDGVSVSPIITLHDLGGPTRRIDCARLHYRLYRGNRTRELPVHFGHIRMKTFDSSGKIEINNLTYLHTQAGAPAIPIWLNDWYIEPEIVQIIGSSLLYSLREHSKEVLFSHDFPNLAEY